MGDPLFEQLVASIVFAEHDKAERPNAPDGGADETEAATLAREKQSARAGKTPSDPRGSSRLATNER
jgi:hypothetical protein